MTLGILLGLSSGLCWGTADFFGGMQSRRLPALAVALWSQIAGGLALLLVLLLSGAQPTLVSIGWGIVAGLFGGTALVLFYRGLAEGVMSVVAPISACGAIVPVLASIATGEVPNLLTGIGIVAAVVGIVLVSRQSGGALNNPQAQRTSVLLALGAALGFGFFFVFLDRGSNALGSSPLWVTGGARIGSLTVLLGMSLGNRRAFIWPGARIWPLTAIGIGDTAANVLFAYASTAGNLGVVSVLGSLYPVVTVLLGRLLLAERLEPPQYIGVGLALSGVALLAGG